jgi:hypothetical protein
MKVFNYDYGYVWRFDCVISGTIVLSRDEWNKIKPRIIKHMFLPSDLENGYRDKHGNEHYNIRTTATQKLFEMFGRKKEYKNQNYQIRVINKKS